MEDIINPYELYLFWDELTRPFHPIETDSIEVFQNLVKNYNSPRRSYHNLNHIHSLIHISTEFKSKIKDYDCVQFAIWFHDVVYNPLNSDNEEKSADFAMEELYKLNLPKSKVDKIIRMILATKTHNDLANSSDTDLKYFLDFDLSILGSNKLNYQKYAQQIREEYKNIPDDLFYKGRKQVLQRFLDSPFIYNTTEFKTLFENPARENIQEEIDLIKNQ
jgi:predicted metal-dependent HD superfamily phosphohydrolase